MTDWPFTDLPDVAVFTTRAVVEEGAWIAYVSHDDKDGAWQFHDAGPGSADMAEARVVWLRSLVKRDPAVRDILDLPAGGCASRAAPDSRWVRDRC
ncbi:MULTISPECIES: hypothetical protein [unclassified Sphingomonas]|uniref:hypothetical protein n=1 Tax=unclassified Sphingomonas TaxID=196159 RepID=UPI0006F9459E|nr:MULTISPECIES: hypothetical protein [unclassified Sphingomonas]KQM23679.1 hypothetical protein ASE58_17080 [Sphingomonas sp. Leaf9]KQM41853.1 hypothetical protein ASE57_16995 [Sphingomonas sp. Leaf11]